jgi:hypothetical protein
MKKMKTRYSRKTMCFSLMQCILACLVLTVISSCSGKPRISFCGSDRSDLYLLLKEEPFRLSRYNTPEDAIDRAPEGTGVIIVSDSYPVISVGVSPEAVEKAKKKRLRLYVEYPASFPGLKIPRNAKKATLERGVITSNVFGDKLKPMALLGINDCHFLQVNAKDPMIILARVAGFDRAEYGIDDVVRYPLLFQTGSWLIATTKLSNFSTGRYGPNESWKEIWRYILSWLTQTGDLQIKNWLCDVIPMYTPDQILPADARKIAVARGATWFYNGRFFIDPSWKDLWLKYQGDGLMPVGPPVSQSCINGDGSLGILEGHASRIYFDGAEQYRYWVRNDVQGEVAFGISSAGVLLKKPEYYKVAGNLIDFIFKSNLRSGARANKDSAVFGLIGWALTHPFVFYSDDNARSVLGMIGASANLKTDQWDREITENILANFRISSKQGFYGPGGRMEQNNIERIGWRELGARDDVINPHPHFESWMWACYLWLYDKTGYTPLLDKAKSAIRLTMEAYPEGWKWTNGIQQERARMILPLAWLVRVEDTEEHRKWLDTVVSKLLESQVECGAIREELGAGHGDFGRTSSNREYGLHEAPLIFTNGDPVADMLYTSNFAFFSLNEAARATGNKKYLEAVYKLSDFLIRIQVKSKNHPDLDGAWFRAFDFNRWDYWASNADAGWGAWSTLTGWIQSWIIATQVLVEEKNSYWELTRKSEINRYMQSTVDLMLK